jgi:hypothetical protein
MITQSKAPKKPQAKALPAEVSEIATAPGEAEAKQIIHYYGIANEGLRAFVRIGFILIDVKARLPHGKYIPWLDKHLGDRSRMHLHRASQIAQGIANHLGWEPQMSHAVLHLKQLPDEVLNLIEGKSARSLLTELREPVPPSHPDTIKACEDLWKSSPALRDEYEPRVLGGEMTYGGALQGMTGKIHSKGKPRTETDHSQRLAQNFAGLARHIKAWDTENMTARERADSIKHIANAVQTSPGFREVLRQILFEATEV